MATRTAARGYREAVTTGGISRGGSRPDALASAALASAARLWFVVAVLGQWIFAYYVAAFYGGAVARGDLGAWNRVLPHGYVPGDVMGNLVVAAHLALAVAILVGGPLQLVPQVRERFPAFHRWNGRIYVLTAFAMSLGGLYMVWTRGAVGDVTQHVAISINALLILACAAFAVRNAVARDLATHRRWALRLFLVVNGVWFFRVGLMFWLAVHQRPVGFDPETFRGPFLTVLAFAQFLLPLGVVELYLRAKGGASAPRRFAMAAGLLVLTAAMGVGIFAATMGMWLPRM